MLANSPPNQTAIGALAPNTQKQDLSLYELLDFIANQLPLWRDDTERQPVSSEHDLNDQLCDYLNHASRHSSWDFLQFRTEVPDSITSGRSLDISPKPSTRTVWVKGRQYNKYQALIPIECKRLPTPKGSDRDEREYVFSSYGIRGGIQRFKLGKHGADHELAAMVGYIQERDCGYWKNEIISWITELRKTDPVWQPSDCFTDDKYDKVLRLSRLRSVHQRPSGLSDIEILHFWIEMK